MDYDVIVIGGGINGLAAAAYLGKGYVTVSQTVPEVYSSRCRGCGTCATVCPYMAVKLEEKPGGVKAKILDGLCAGCGICVSRCPSGALNNLECSDSQIVSTLEALFSQV